MNQELLEIKNDILRRREILNSLATQYDAALHVLDALEAGMLTEQEALNMLGAALRTAPDSARNAVS